MDGQSDASILQPSPYPPNAFHRQLSQQQSQQQAQQLLRNSAKFSNVSFYKWSRVFIKVTFNIEFKAHRFQNLSLQPIHKLF